MMNTLGVAGDFFADHACRVGIVLGAAHPADGFAVDDLDIERAGRRAIVRADGASNAGGGDGVHSASVGNCAGGVSRASHEMA